MALHERQFAPMNSNGHNARMAIILVFLLGIANFAVHRAVLDSGHAIVSAMQPESGFFSARMTLSIEFALLLAALLLVSSGSYEWGWVYALYSLANGFAAWLILTRRI